MTKNTYIIIIGLIVIVIFGSWLALSNNNSDTDNVVLETAEKQATLAIDYGDREPEIFQIDFAEGTTVFDALKNKAEELGLNLKTKTYEGMGVFIEAIGDKENGQDGKYWLYYVNGEMPMESADKMIIELGDKIEFKFEKSSF